MDLYIGALGITVVGRHRRGVILRDGHIVAAGESGNDLNRCGLYSGKAVMVVTVKIYDRAKFLPVTTCKQNPS
jgi:hypothetical protein